MSPIDKLKSVLCGTDGKCCIAGSDEDRAIIDRALQALEQPAVEPEAWYDGRKFYATPSAAHMDCADIKALRPLYEAPRAALAEQAPVQEPARPDILERLSYHALERDDLTLDDCLTYLQTGGWYKARGRTDRELVLQITSLLASAPQAQQPACAAADG